MNINYQGKKFEYDPPTLCPWCHNSSQPLRRWEDFDTDKEGKIHMILGVRCQFVSCNRVYVVDYVLVNGKKAVMRLLNGHPKGPDWPKAIKELGSRFQDIYLQSLLT